MTAFDDAWTPTSAEFIAVAVDEVTLPGRLPMAHRMRLAVRSIAPGSDAIAAWVSDAGSKVVTEASFDEVLLPVRKCATIAVLTDDVVAASAVDAERMTMNALQRAVRIAVDTAFVSDDAGTASAPPGVLSQAITVASSGSTPSAIATDLSNMIAIPSGAHVALDGAVWIMSPAASAYLRLVKVADSDGTIGGFPVLTSDAATGVVALVATQYIGVARSDRVVLAATGHATLDMAGGSSPTFSLWQKNCTGIKVEMFANWQTFGPSDSNGDTFAVVSLEGAAWAA
jgi:hypothetical protein